MCNLKNLDVCADAYSLISELLMSDPKKRATVSRAQCHWWVLWKKDINCTRETVKLSEPVDSKALLLRLNKGFTCNPQFEMFTLMGTPVDHLELDNSASDHSLGPCENDDNYDDSNDNKPKCSWNDVDESKNLVADNEKAELVMLRKKHNVSPHDGVNNFFDSTEDNSEVKSRQLSVESENGKLIYDFDDIEAVLNSLDILSSEAGLPVLQERDVSLSPVIDGEASTGDSLAIHTGSVSIDSSEDLSDSDYLSSVSQSGKTAEKFNSCLLSYRSELHMPRFSTPKRSDYLNHNKAVVSRSFDSAHDGSNLFLSDDVFVKNNEMTDKGHFNSSYDDVHLQNNVVCVSRLDGLQLNRPSIGRRIHCTSLGNEFTFDQNNDVMRPSYGNSTSQKSPTMLPGVETTKIVKAREKRKRQRKVFDEDEDMVLKTAVDVAKKVC